MNESTNNSVDKQNLSTPLKDRTGNRLIHESSPYLLQHAHNPVDWYPWGDEAFEKAKKEDKPVLISIGYAACHWCHVMEKESFEHKEVAAIMNKNFINIKVDREERPDVDHIYMDALQAISGSGGWPLNVFLTPDRRPFFGGTYFPPVKAFNRSSWTEILLAVSQAYREKKNEIEMQAENITQYLRDSNSFGIKISSDDEIFNNKKIDEAFSNIMKTADSERGGFGKAPKFPQTFTINFLLRYAHIKNNEEALQQALFSLDKMLQGGIYDHVGGGFARYSTDTEWLVPHFEKMLYDNALLISALSEAYQLTGNNIYKKTIEETFVFIERELMHADGGFYSSVDADSEGEEGKFYVWHFEEMKNILQNDAEIFCEYFDITPKGNWEGKNIVRVRKPLNEFTQEKNIDVKEIQLVIEKGKGKLLEKRAERIRPLLDDKIILGWNALMNIAYSKVFAATGHQSYKNKAIKNMNFLLRSFTINGKDFYHTWKNGKSKHPAFLDDYSNLIAALMELAQITANYTYLDKAFELTNTVLENFADDESAFFFYTHKDQKDILLRKKEIYDSAVPSGNSMMASNLYKLSIFFNKADWRQRAGKMVASLGDVIIKYPTSFGGWLSLLFEMVSGTSEIAILGKDWKIYLEKILGIYISHKLAMANEHPVPRYPMLADKAKTNETMIYLCENYACRQPVNTIQDFVNLLQSKYFL